MDDDAPNFSYAYAGSSTPSTQSWNPALRPENESAQDQSTKLQPSPQIIPQSKPSLEDGQEEDSEDDVPSIPEVETTSAHLNNGIPGHERPSGEDFFSRQQQAEDPESEEPSSSEEEEEQEDEDEEGESEEDEEAEDAHGEGSALAAATESLSLEDATAIEPAGATQGAPAPASDTSEEESEESEDEEEEHPEAQYEHQGETTLLEEAVAESENAPLVADAEPDSDDWGASGEDFDLGGMPQDALVETPLQAPPQTPRPEAGGTTIGDDFIGNTTVGGNTGKATDDWGNGDGDDFFAGAAIQPADPTQSGAEENPGAHVIHKSEDSAPAAGDSAWDLELDDDFLPDTEEAGPVFELDDEGFLEDETTETTEQPIQTASAHATTRYAPAASQAPQPTVNSYGIPAPQLTNLTQPGQTPAIPTPTALYGTYGQPAPSQQKPTRPEMPSSAESFAAKAREGYHSPYDLPEDIVTTRRRPAPRTASIPSAPPSAPPRSSSMSNSGAPRHLPPSNLSASSLSPPSSGHSYQPQMTGLPPIAPPKPAAPAKSPSTDFFAELPVTSKPRPSGRYTPQPAAPQQPPAPGFPPKERTPSWSSLRNEFKPDSDNYMAQLQQPERMPVFPEQPTAPVRTNSLPVPQPAPAPPSNRYSPAPSQAPSAPPANARYSPAPQSAPVANARYSPAPPPPQGSVTQALNQHTPPALGGPPRTPSQSYLPRTSSPLAYHTSRQQSEPAANVPQHTPDMSRSSLEGVTEEQAQQQIGLPPTARTATPPIRSTPSSVMSSPRKKGNYTPQYQSMDASAVPAPSQTESPPASFKPLVRSFSNMEPPAAAFGGPLQPAYTVPSSQDVNTIPPRRQPSLQYDCIAPTDERAADPLERWRGYPIFKWGLGGTAVTTFPKQVPRYGGGASAPMVKCNPGEIRTQSVKQVLPLSEDITKFPGPLKAKSKKKDVSAWLAQRIGALEAYQQSPGLDLSLSADELKRLEEKILLWKVLQVFIDNDGVLEGNTAVDVAVRKIFAADADASADGEGSFTTAAALVGRPRSNTIGVQADPVDPKAVEELRTHLTKGDREKAVWHAVDQRLWAHAMLLSSTLNKDIWKQVVQEFVQKEVKKLGRNNQALAVLYEIFAGNHDDCIDELVPASARAGFQMMSTDGADTTENALQGLEKWRETLALVLNNRSDGDPAALVSLGKLLAGYGRVEAAHICFIFARSRARINGVDDPETNIVLIGADHKKNPLDLGIDLDPVLLTEVYEFGLSLSAQGGSHIIPHLQNYKLAHAYQLAEYGHRADAQAYCDAIAASMKATTKISPYFNGSFVAMLDDLSKRLSQSPKDGSSSWLSKPSMDKVSSSLFSKFTNFVAGDDEDAASNAPVGEAGPFAKIAGGTPTLSPTQSSADLYGAYSSFGIALSPPSAPGNSRYAPSNAYAPRTSMESTRSKYEPQGRPSLESNDGSVGMRAVSESFIPLPQSPTSFAPPQQAQLNPAVHQPSLTKAHSYSPLRAEYNASEPSYGSSYQPAPAPVTVEPASSYGGFQPLQASFDGSPVGSSGFQPPSSSFEPSSYQPYQPPEEDSAGQSLRPKKSFMDDDDDDDLAARAAALKISGSSNSKSENDRLADEAFRKAAEEDAKRGKETAAQRKSGSWLGGWFGGGAKKDNAMPANKPIKAKLGEENSFKYDPELKKWVNTKGGAAEASKPMATPPPPRSGPPSRAVSTQSAMSPPSSLPNASGLSIPPTSNPLQRSSSMPPPMGLPGSRASTPGIPSDNEGPRPPVLSRPSMPTGPPSRPGTGMSTASSIDDLLGAPQARKGAAKGKKKGGRYVDVMAKP